MRIRVANAGSSSLKVDRVDDGTTVEAMFTSKSPAKSVVVVTHQKLATKSDAEKMKAWWGERLAEIVV